MRKIFLPILISKPLRNIFIFSFLWATVFVSHAQPAAVKGEGILGPYDDTQRQEFIGTVIRDRHNLFADKLPLSPTDRQMRRAEQYAGELGHGHLAQYFAVYYVFPEDGNPITLYGILMPASEEIADIHLASMHVRTDEKSLPRLKSLPRSTIIYGVDGSGNKAWLPLEFFRQNEDYPGYISAEGLYAYTLRPNAKMQGRYGNTAFYLDILDPILLDRAVIPLEDNLTVTMRNLPDEVAKLVYFSRPAFYSRIIPMLERYPDYAIMPVELVVVNSAEGKINLDLFLPAKILLDYAGDEINIAPAPGMFQALERLRSVVYSELFLRVDEEWAEKIAECELSVVHFNEAGEIRFMQKRLDGNISREVYVRDAAGEEFRKVRGYIKEDSGSQTYVFTNLQNEDIFPVLESFMAANGVNRPHAEHTGETNRYSKYDMAMHGIDKVRMKTPEPKTEPSYYVAPDRYFLLDIYPDFYGGGIDGFHEWLYDRIDYPYEGFIDFEFIIGADGGIYNFEINDATDWTLVNEVVRVLSGDIQWAPGEISGVPVNVMLNVQLNFLP